MGRIVLKVRIPLLKIVCDTFCDTLNAGRVASAQSSSHALFFTQDGSGFSWHCRRRAALARGQESPFCGINLVLMLKNADKNDKGV